MQRRMILLFVLFVVLAALYATVTRQNMPGIQARQKAQTETLNHLDEVALGRKAEDRSGDGG